jgi:ATP-dependent protease ClpP protease subunit
MSNKLKDRVEMVHNYGVDLSTKTTWIEGEIDVDQAEMLSKNLSILDSNLNGKAITIILNSEGGCVTQGLRMYNLIKRCKNYVRILVEGHAESIATIILQAADERVMLHDAHLMVHIGAESHVEDHPENIKRWQKKNDEDGKRMEDIYLGKIKEKKKRFTRNQLKELLKFDTILKAKEAIDYGLIDRIEDEKSE